LIVLGPGLGLMVLIGLRLVVSGLGLGLGLELCGLVNITDKTKKQFDISTKVMVHGKK